MSSDWDIQLWRKHQDKNNKKKAWAIAYEKQFLDEIENESN